MPVLVLPEGTPTFQSALFATPGTSSMTQSTTTEASQQTLSVSDSTHTLISPNRTPCKVPVIIGSSIGGAFAVLLLIFLSFLLYRRWRLPPVQLVPQSPIPFEIDSARYLMSTAGSTKSLRQQCFVQLDKAARLTKQAGLLVQEVRSLTQHVVGAPPSYAASTSENSTP
ncbi:hypothetical protein C8J56DRAFT_1170457 [Mycena floridula]|nr:hypothetical protein C8J56DRAFT_1170457 [Mycena floridula]